MKLVCALVIILLGAAASGPSLARGGQIHSFGRPASPTFSAGHFHSFARPGFAVHNPGFAMHNRGFVWTGTGSFHHRFHSRVVIVGAPLYYAPYYYAYYNPYPYYYPPVAMSYMPPAYGDQGESGPAEAYWYYCASANAYYPHVRDCPEGWQRVAPQPPPQSGY